MVKVNQGTVGASIQAPSAASRTAARMFREMGKGAVEFFTKVKPYIDVSMARDRRNDRLCIISHRGTMVLPCKRAALLARRLMKLPDKDVGGLNTEVTLRQVLMKLPGFCFRPPGAPACGQSW